MFRMDLKRLLGGLERNTGAHGRGAERPPREVLSMRFRAAFVTVLVLATGACAVVDARESGRRDSVRYQDDVALDFDDDVQCYRVRDHADHFFYDGFFYRYSDGDWYQSRAFRGPWRVIRVEVLPSRLERWAQIRRERFEAERRREEQARREDWRRREEQAREEARRREEWEQRAEQRARDERQRARDEY